VRYFGGRVSKEERYLGGEREKNSPWGFYRITRKPAIAAAGESMRERTNGMDVSGNRHPGGKEKTNRPEGSLSPTKEGLEIYIRKKKKGGPKRALVVSIPSRKKKRGVHREGKEKFPPKKSPAL